MNDANAQYTVFDADTGQILGRGTCMRTDMQLQSRAAHEIIAEGAYDDMTVYLPQGVPTQRPALTETVAFTIKADGAEAVEIADVPSGTDVTLAGDVYTIADGSMVFTTAKPGIYRIDLRPPFPYQWQALKVTAEMKIAITVTAADIKAEAARRLAETDWMVLRAAEGGKAVPDEVMAQRAAIRARSNKLEKRLPPDFRDDRHWQ